MLSVPSLVGGGDGRNRGAARGPAGAHHRWRGERGGDSQRMQPGAHRVFQDMMFGFGSALDRRDRERARTRAREGSHGCEGSRHHSPDSSRRYSEEWWEVEGPSIHRAPLPYPVPVPASPPPPDTQNSGEEPPPPPPETDRQEGSPPRQRVALSPPEPDVAAQPPEERVRHVDMAFPRYHLHFHHQVHPPSREDQGTRGEWAEWAPLTGTSGRQRFLAVIDLSENPLQQYLSSCTAGTAGKADTGDTRSNNSKSNAEDAARQDAHQTTQSNAIAHGSLTATNHEARDRLLHASSRYPRRHHRSPATDSSSDEPQTAFDIRGDWLEGTARKEFEHRLEGYSEAVDRAAAVRRRIMQAMGVRSCATDDHDEDVEEDEDEDEGGEGNEVEDASVVDDLDGDTVSVTRGRHPHRSTRPQSRFVVDQRVVEPTRKETARQPPSHSTHVRRTNGIVGRSGDDGHDGDEDDDNHVGLEQKVSELVAEEPAGLAEAAMAVGDVSDQKAAKPTPAQPRASVKDEQSLQPPALSLTLPRPRSSSTRPYAAVPPSATATTSTSVSVRSSSVGGMTTSLSTSGNGLTSESSELLTEGSQYVYDDDDEDDV